jgi:hypothetical protein
MEALETYSSALAVHGDALTCQGHASSHAAHRQERRGR